MPHLQPVTLAFPQGLHVGDRGVNLEEAGVHLPSDTIFSALVDGWSRSGGDADAWMTPFREGDPPFLLTSAFPYAGKVRFYPAPVDLQLLMPAGQTGASTGKAVKRIRFLSQELLRRLLSGQTLPDSYFAAAEPAEGAHVISLQEGALCLLAQEADGLPCGLRKNERGGPRPLHRLDRQAVWQRERTPRVTVDRINSASSIFHAGRVRFAPGCGLWFGVQWRTPDAAACPGGPSWREALCSCLDLLGEEGIGGERSAGYGAFDPTWGEPFHLRGPRRGRAAWLLSRYLPAPAELPACLADACAAYALVRVGGWARTLHGADQRRKQINLLTEGSLIAWPDADVVGKVEDLRPDYQASAGDFPHPAWRSGLAVAAGLKSRREEPR